MKRHLLIFSTVSLALLTGTSQAHYPWLELTKANKGQPPTASFYFEEAPRAGDGKYLDPFLERSTIWLRSSADAEPTRLTMSEVKSGDKRWMSTKLPEYKALALDLNCTWGIYRYGKTDVLLHYYARTIDARTPEELSALAKAPHLKLNVIPKQLRDGVEVQVLWQGKPAANVPIYVRGVFGGTIKTNAEGKATFKPKRNGKVWFRAYYREGGKSGTFEGKEYSEKRHHCSMTMFVKAGS